VFFLAIGLVAAFSACATRPAVTPGSDYRDEWQTARDRFAAANARLHEGLLEVSASDLPALVDAEDRLGDDVRSDLKALTDEGARHAGVAVALRPDGVEGQLYLALNLAIGGLVRSRAAALLEGLPGRIRGAYEEALRLDPGYAFGGGYRLKGKFLMSAPWPVRDLRAAREALERANGIAAVRQNFLFLGDLHYREGRQAEALDAWRRASSLPAHVATRDIDAAVRELALRRTAAARAAGTPLAK
jgi:tetratricopeptide (TPR) repeat protein